MYYKRRLALIEKSVLVHSHFIYVPIFPYTGNVYNVVKTEVCKGLHY